MLVLEIIIRLSATSVILPTLVNLGLVGGGLASTEKVTIITFVTLAMKLFCKPPNSGLYCTFKGSELADEPSNPSLHL
jgi:hypothetical protein